MSLMTDNTSRILKLAIAVALIALAANCFLKYLWWTACYSAWYGIPKMTAQWKEAGFNASFNGWSFIALDAASVAVLFSLIRLRSVELSWSVKSAMRLTASLAMTIAGTALFALVLSWVKQGIQ